MAFISYTERPISALSLTGEADAGLIWVDFNLVMPQETPIHTLSSELLGCPSKSWPPYCWCSAHSTWWSLETRARLRSKSLG